MLNESIYMKKLTEEIPDRKDMEIVTERDILLNFEAEHVQEIGIIENAPYFDFRCDVYKDKNGKLFRYCNVRYPQRAGGAAIVILHIGDRRIFLLEHHYRPFIRQTQIECPRGFAGITDKNAVETIVRELEEECGIQIYEWHSSISSLGYMYPDTGLTNNKVQLFQVDVYLSNGTNIQFQSHDDEELIEGFHFISESEFREQIKNGMITDSFSIVLFYRFILNQ